MNSVILVPHNITVIHIFYQLTDLNINYLKINYLQTSSLGSSSLWRKFSEA